MKDKNISFRCESSLRDDFQKKYPYCLSRFLILCIKYAIRDKKFFDAVYFNTASEVL